MHDRRRGSPFTAAPHRSQEERESSNETKLVVQTITEIGQIERTNTTWETLYGDHKNKVVYIGRKVVGVIQNIGRRNPNEKLSNVNAERINGQANELDAISLWMRSRKSSIRRWPSEKV